MSEIWKIISELDLAKIRDQIDMPFRLLVTGEPEEAQGLALALSRRPGVEGVHPWIIVAPLPLDPDALLVHPDVALLVTESPDLSELADHAVHRLSVRGVPVITVVAGEAAARQVGADLPRPGEADRVLLVDPTGPASLARQLTVPLSAALARPDRPEIGLSLGRHLPVFRDSAIGELIDDTARANAVYSFTTGLGEMVPAFTVPLVIGDTIILTKNQLLMAYKIALVAGKDGHPRDLMGEVAGVIGGSLIFRQIARELVGLIPVIGIVPKVAVSYAGTRAIGAMVHVWAAEDRHPTKAEFRTWYRAAMARGRELARALVKSRRERRSAKAPEALPAPADELPVVTL
jgi:hypothetical protein